METATLFFRETNLDSAVPNFSCLLVAAARHMLQPLLMQTSLTVQILYGMLCILKSVGSMTFMAPIQS